MDARGMFVIDSSYDSFLYSILAVREKRLSPVLGFMLVNNLCKSVLHCTS